MNLLLDTHIFLWWDGPFHLLSPQTRTLCSDPNNVLFLSMASLWEMQIKVQLGKMSFQHSLSKTIQDQQQNNGLRILPITLQHVYALDTLPLHHKDPFDRLIIAQAQAENMTLLSADAIFKQYLSSVIG